MDPDLNYIYPFDPIIEVCENNAKLLNIHEDIRTYVGPMGHVHDILEMYYLMIDKSDF